MKLTDTPEDKEQARWLLMCFFLHGILSSGNSLGMADAIADAERAANIMIEKAPK